MTNTSWPKIIIAFDAIHCLLTGIHFEGQWPHDHPILTVGSSTHHFETFWPIQIALNLFFFWLMWIGYEQINLLRKECLKAKGTPLNDRGPVISLPLPDR
jgi:hypothetical protein